jgi:hypothetical protein
VENRAVAMKRLDAWLQNCPPEAGLAGRIKALVRKSEAPTIVCTDCEKRVPLWDDLEQCFASLEVQQRVRELQEESTRELDSESKERVLVGEVISTVALAGQISARRTNQPGVQRERPRHRYGDRIQVGCR